MASICQGKSSWPELLGVDGKCAVETIERENSLVEAIIVPEGSSVPENFACNRVWVWVDKDGIVYLVPGFYSEVGELKRYSIHYDRSGRSKGTAEVVFIRPAEAVVAVKRYNQLDGKPMKIEIAGTNFAPPHANAAFGNSNGLSGRVRSRGGALGQLCGGGGGRGHGRGCGEKVSAEDLDADLEKLEWEELFSLTENFVYKSHRIKLFHELRRAVMSIGSLFVVKSGRYGAHSSDCNLHLCFIQPDDGKRRWT
ncbi:hypothetical protein H0E87_017945 [Populus deltoides]|uniref:RRM domain-containing protein n=1 Tax=Populus deltoides TaxID=3696 RepID=A0A8T2Y274_POPDE|nr:hypothetical protein H0E87_017945 [Populus deltoides]